MLNLVFVLSVLLSLGSFLPGSTSEHNKVIGKQTWGYVEVRPGAFTFWWLYYTTDTADFSKKPLVIWLQGGPGASSTGYGNFAEIGPLDINLENRTHTWVKHANVLFIDNPVGSGFSYVNHTSLLAKNNSQIVADLVEFTNQFLQKIPEFQTIPLYIFSESYGGKMASQFTLRLSKQISQGKIKCNLKGVALGDSWISPIDSVITWAPYLYSTSLVDNSGYVTINSSAYQVKAALDKSQFRKATALWEATESLVDKLTNGVNVYNILAKTVPLTDKEVKKPRTTAQKHVCAYHNNSLSELMNGKIKKMLRIIPENVTWGGQSADVFAALYEDFMKPVTLTVESLLNNTHINVTVYTGQLDMIVDTMGTTQWVERLNWAGIHGWKSAKRSPIIVNGSTQAFVKSFKNLNFYWILDAGHMVPMDSPETGVELLQLVTNQKKI